MYVDTRFGDFPHWLPTRARRTRDETFTGWMLLSYRKPVTASSARDSFPARAITDENPRTFWVAGRNRPGEWLIVDLGRVFDVKAIQVNYADYESGLYGTDSSVYTQFRLRVSTDGHSWRSVADLTQERRDRPNGYVELSEPMKARYVRYEHVHVGAANLAISDIRVFGNGSGPPPATPQGLTAQRDHDERNAIIAWEPVADVVGYNVRWGISPTKLLRDLPALHRRRRRQDTRAAGTHGWSNLLGSDRELRRERRVASDVADTDPLKCGALDLRGPSAHIPKHLPAVSLRSHRWTCARSVELPLRFFRSSLLP
jgi:hypothetical protein